MFLRIFFHFFVSSIREFPQFGPVSLECGAVQVGRFVSPFENALFMMSAFECRCSLLSLLN